MRGEVNKLEARQFVFDNFKKLHVLERCGYGGVYALVSAGNMFGLEIEYIGSSINIENRLRTHKNFDRETHTVFILRLSKTELRYREEVEYGLIQALKPKLNKVIVNGRRAPYKPEDRDRYITYRKMIDMLKTP
jgi:hypothetical protein